MKRLIPYLIIFIIAFAMGLPWYLKAGQYTGSILSVHHSSIQGQGLATPMNIETESPLAGWFMNTVVRMVAAPWTFSLFPGQHQGDTFGPLFIAILPFLFITGVPVRAWFLLFAGSVYWALMLFLEMWFVQGGSSIRYNTLTMAIGAMFIPWIITRLSTRSRLGRLTSIMMAIMVALGTVLFFKRYHREWIAILTNQSRDEYYCATLPEYPVIKRINALTDGKSVMSLYNYSDYLIEVPSIAPYRSYRNPEEMRADLCAKKVGYIFANDKLDTSANSHAFPELPGKTCIMSLNGFRLFRLDSCPTDH